MMLDRLVKIYPQYTHDDIYKMPLADVMAYDELDRKQRYIEAKMSEERRKQQSFK